MTDKEFWEWCGFYKLDMPASPWLHGKLGEYDWKSYELPPIDLNNLFKYAVPKLASKYPNSIEVKLLAPLASAPEFWVVDITTQHHPISSGNGKNPAPALKKAIEQAMEAKK